MSSSAPHVFTRSLTTPHTHTRTHTHTHTHTHIVGPLSARRPRLFSDLVHTTESLKNYKTSEALRGGDDGSGGGGEGGGADGGGPSSRKIDEYMEAYRADNAKLVKEVSSRTRVART